ncbi:putative Rubisco accumulation factor 1.2, chloroplastic [Cocos nucifera]|uniref:Putative Rubisco accumulation factor 1.2, chloroplastic n=1 Tax=Cocos nucifera TaxID=13894 RepID=A0A8K0N522_COCNU|nr:putative Rubisco accumulation factor 1.2, chloroplastic [Cocos nucifera]
MKSARPISATKIPSSPPPPSPPGELYQPFRPPPSPLPQKYRSLGPAERIDILRNRLGLWHEYAPLITTLANDGFTPPSIEEVTGISGVEQNRLVVAVQVRDSLLSSSFDPDLLAFFDAGGGADLLYELRFLNAAQRVAAAQCVVEQRFDQKAAQELARAVKDFPRRRGDDGWACFSTARPGDCLAYTHFRLSREALSAGDRIAALERAMEAAETEGAKKRIEEEMEKAASGRREGIEGGEGAERVTVPVVRLMYGEVAEATSVVLLPVCRAGEGAEGVGGISYWRRG